jgi:hypothetical protein
MCGARGVDVRIMREGMGTSELGVTDRDGLVRVGDFCAYVGSDRSFRKFKRVRVAEVETEPGPGPAVVIFERAPGKFAICASRDLRVLEPVG